MTQDELFVRIKECCDVFAAGNDHLSELRILLAYILAYYKVRGTEPEAMLEGVRETVEWLVKR